MLLLLRLRGRRARVGRAVATVVGAPGGTLHARAHTARLTAAAPSAQVSARGG